MLADQLDYIIGVDPHRDSHTLAVVQVVSGVVVFEADVAASSDGYAEALKLTEEHAPGRRAFAIEGTCSFGAGLTRFLTGRDERVLEVGRLRRERRSGGKTDALDAVRAARSALSNERPTTPRAGGERQALQALVAAREGAVNAKRAGLCQLRDLLITTPEPLRSELRPLTRARLLQRLAATRPHGRHDPELRGSLLAPGDYPRGVSLAHVEEWDPPVPMSAVLSQIDRSAGARAPDDGNLMGSRLPDDDLTDRWERQQLGGFGVSHVDHVRVAWVLHQRHGASEAEQRLVEGTRQGCDHYGVPEKFDEDLTRRWARAVSEAAGAGPDQESFDAFIARNPELRRGGLLGTPHEPKQPR